MKKYVKLISLFFLCLNFFICQAQKNGPVKITVEFTNQYCGGARPTPEIEGEMKVARLLTNSQLKLTSINTKKKKVIYIQTNSKGEATIKLPVGTYSVKIGKKYNKELALNYDDSCKKMAEIIWKTIEITPDTKVITFAIEFSCSPCIKRRE